MIFVITASVFPPKNPPKDPNKVPVKNPKVAAEKPIKKETRREIKTLQKTSLPSPSVPRICLTEKNKNFSLIETSFGLYGR